jgi:hypothetical protein
LCRPGRFLEGKGDLPEKREKEDPVVNEEFLVEMV